MSKRFVPMLLIALLLVLHGQLWFGRGSVRIVNKLQSELDSQKVKNTQAALVNDRLEAEIRDLKEGLEIVEEKARSELGMVKNNEIFVQVAH
jgi:cell division protein FtsB